MRTRILTASSMVGPGADAGDRPDLRGHGARWPLALGALALLAGCGLLPGNEGTDAAPPIEEDDTEELLDADVAADSSKPDTQVTFDLGGGDTDDGDGGSDVATDAGSDDAGDADAADASDVDAAAKVCTPGTLVCNDGAVVTCNANGDGFQDDAKPCGEGKECSGGACVAKKICPSGKQFCKGVDIWQCSGDGTADSPAQACPTGTACAVAPDDKASCAKKICDPGAKACAGDSLGTCNGTGTGLVSTDQDCSADGKSCVAGGSGPACAAPSCGDGKANQASEECDLGADNGKPGKLCDEGCKISAGKCLVPDDCAGLASPCVATFLCVANKCLGIAKTGGGCSDGDACTIGDHCIQGTCLGAPLHCDDDIGCTLDGCDPTKGCTHQNLHGPACSDGNPCTVGDACSFGACTAGNNACECSKDADCTGFDDGDPCTGVLGCVQGSCKVQPGSVPSCQGGVCVGAGLASGEACSGKSGVWTGVRCLLVAAKDKAACATAAGKWQDDGPCQQAACNPALGVCDAAFVVDGSPCSDGNACTATDQCTSGACVGKALDCDDNNPCTTDGCDATGGCTHQAASAPCDDGDPSSGGDACVNGSCQGTPIVDCKADGDCKSDAGNLCAGKVVCDAALGKCKLDLATVVVCDPTLSTPCAPVACDPKDGSCKANPTAAGTACDDGNACTVAEQCEGGDCKGGIVIACADNEPCTDDSCNTALGCLFAANSKPCDDGDPCTKDDACQGGSCQPGPSTCGCSKDEDCAGYASANLCKGGWKCSKLALQCIFDAAKAVQCGDGVCTVAGAADAVTCAGLGGFWKPDGPCATTACQPTSGSCKQTVTADGVWCSDGNPCTILDVCKEGACSAKPHPCDDGNPCTDVGCDVGVVGGCTLLPGPLDGKECSDGNDCTSGETCANGGCAGGTKLDCDDGNPCTADACLPGKGCVHPASKAPCDDGNDCSVGDACDGTLGMCLAGKQEKVCKDGNICTKDGCDPKVKGGCGFLPDEQKCNDGNVCTNNDNCVVGICQAGTPTDCNDANLCTDDSCGPTTGCVHTPAVKACDDGDLCTQQDTCVKGGCTGLPVVCDDDNVCTANSCDGKVGCVFPPGAGDCGPFAACKDAGGKPGCAFHTAAHVVFSEVYVGDRLDPADDFVELHSSLTATADVGGYLLQTRPWDGDAKAPWQDVVALPTGTKIPPGGYLLLAPGAKTVVGGVAVDVQVPKLALDYRGGQWRLYDAGHTLVHDQLAWGQAAALEGKAAKAWFSARSLERRAASDSDATAMQPGGKAHLAGNAHDSDDNSADFVERQTPEPQGKGQFEPACGGASCSGGTVCDYAGGGSQCAKDSACLYGCGSSQSCSASIGGCILASKAKLVISEIVLGLSDDPAARFVEIHNAGSQAEDISGFVLEFKGPESQSTVAWQPPLVQVPARTVLEPGAYWLVGTKDFAKRAGGVDAVATIPLDPSGGALRLRDPRSDVETDRFGWGATKSASGSPLQVGGGLAPGLAMTRKASAASNGQTMGESGNERLAGNGQDTNQDGADFLVVLSPSPNSFHSGAFGPACKGACGNGLICNFVRGKDACVDPSCNGQCTSGEVCNIKTGACDLSVVLAEVSVLGPAVQSAGIQPTQNEFVVLYNPGKAPVSVGGMALQYIVPGLNWQTRTQVFPTGLCINAKNAPCESGEICQCQGASKTACSSNSQCSGTFIDAGGFMLIVGKTYDPALPKPDLVSDFAWEFNSNSGALRLVRSDGGNYGWKGIIADSVAWGESFAWANLPFSLPAHAQGCSFRRRPWLEASAEELASPDQAAFYGGAGARVFVPAKEWAVSCPRHARSAASPTAHP